MDFHSFDSLQLFSVVARHGSFTAAAEHLNLTKGAISYQINRLEEDLQYPVFERTRRGIKLTEQGQRLLEVSQQAFNTIRSEIKQGRLTDHEHITIGLSTYFASRWLSSRLMLFMTRHPGISLRLQPVVNLVDTADAGIDITIRWGNGSWSDVETEQIFSCPAFPTAGVHVADEIRKHGLPSILPDVPLLHDTDTSTAWRDWHKAARLPYRSTRSELVIADPNVRVQAVIDGQGLALNDTLTGLELEAGTLARVSDVSLETYGYHLAYPPEVLDNPSIVAFRDWIIAEAQAPAAS